MTLRRGIPRSVLSFGRPSTMGGLVKWGGMLWQQGKARKPTECAMSGRAIEPGDDVFRPITNNAHRMRRVLVDVMRERLG